MLTERVQKRVDDLLDEADEAIGSRDWSLLYERCDLVLLIDPENPDANYYRDIAIRELGIPDSRDISSDSRASNASEPGIFKKQLSRLFAVLYTDMSRMGRRDFWLWMVGLWFFWIVFEAQFNSPLLTAPVNELGFVGWSLIGFFVVVFMPAVVNKCVRRLHDLDKSGNWVFLLFVPLANLWLLMGMFFVGYRDENRYGPVPGVVQNNGSRATR